ncbi:MAG: hypothetical protein KDE51_09855 [Anaerolineales bacterium]|nr:hypothetical protein [Anaerolineales bacterium]
MFKRRLPFLFVLLLLPTAVLSAQETPPLHQAGLVIDHGDGRVDTHCVAFAEEEISGAELLQRSGVPLVIGGGGGMGAAVCSLADTGCPADDCFCDCPGGADCVYWSYWLLREGEWRYAAIGANGSKVRHGDVQGWVWGPGTVTEATPPLSTSIDQICEGVVPVVDNSAAVAETNETTSFPLTTYIGFGALLLTLGLVLVVVRRRTQQQMN